MKRWLVIVAAVGVGFILGALCSRQYLLQRARRDQELANIAYAQRARNIAEAYIDVLNILEDPHTDSVKRGNAAEDFCSTELALYYKWFRDSDDSHAPGQRELLKAIKDNADKWPELKRELDKWMPYENPQSQSK